MAYGERSPTASLLTIRRPKRSLRHMLHGGEDFFAHQLRLEDFTFTLCVTTIDLYK